MKIDLWNRIFFFQCGDEYIGTSFANATLLCYIGPDGQKVSDFYRWLFHMNDILELENNSMEYWRA